MFHKSKTRWARSDLIGADSRLAAILLPRLAESDHPWKPNPGGQCYSRLLFYELDKQRINAACLAAKKHLQNSASAYGGV